MNSTRLVFAGLLAIATVLPGFGQDANTDKKPESTEQPVAKDGLRRITHRLDRLAIRLDVTSKLEQPRAIARRYWKSITPGDQYATTAK